MIAGVDIGGTKTHILAERQPRSNAEHLVATSSWRRWSDTQDALALAELIIAIADGQPDATVIGAHGCDSDIDCLRLQNLLSKHLHGVVLVLNDSELLLPAASKIRGVSVIAGTGSIAVSRDNHGQMMTAGGWGWILGDEGSASGLVREAARKVRLSLDAGASIDVLGEALLETLKAQSPVEFGRALSRFGSADRIGALAPVVFEAASAGSHLAEEVIAEGGDALARLVEQLVKRGASAEAVVTAGGVVSHQKKLLDAFKIALSRRVPGSTLTLLNEPPVIGAVELARQLADGEGRSTLPSPHRAGRPATTRHGE